MVQARIPDARIFGGHKSPYLLSALGRNRKRTLMNKIRMPKSRVYEAKIVRLEATGNLNYDVTGRGVERGLGIND